MCFAHPGIDSCRRYDCYGVTGHVAIRTFYLALRSVVSFLLLRATTMIITRSPALRHNLSILRAVDVLKLFTRYIFI